MKPGKLTILPLLALAPALGLVLAGNSAGPVPLTPMVANPVVANIPASGPADASAKLPSPPTQVIFAKQALLVDMGSGRTLYAKQADTPFLPASVTKTMTAFVAFEMLSKRQLRPDQVFSESEEAYKHWHHTGSRMFLEKGEPITVDQLLMGIMTISANDGAVVLAENAGPGVDKWVERMNATARELGMTGSHFGTPNGWMDNGNTHVSASDLVKLTDAMLTRHPELYHRYIGHPEYTWNGITQKNHDPILGVVPGADGIKTGFTGEARYNFLGSAIRNGRRLVLVLAGVERPAQRAQTAKALMEWGFSDWDGHPIFQAGDRIGTAQVQGGTQDSVPMLAPRPFFVTMPKGSSAPVSMRITYQGPIMAPIAKGQQVGTLELTVGHDSPTRVPLVAAQDVPRGGLVDRLKAGLARLL